MERKIMSIWNEQDYGMKVLDSGWYRLLFKLQDTFVKKSIEFYTTSGLSYLPLPITTGSISSPMGLGSDSIPVKVKMKGEQVYLADSMQFLLEYGCRLAEKGCFYLMPSFRGEETDERHLAQFFHSEAEIKGNLIQVMAMVEDYISYLSQSILDKHEAELCCYLDNVEHLRYIAKKNSIPKLPYSEAVKELENYPEAFNILYGNIRAINKIGERILLDKYGGYLWITNFDERIVPFYQAVNDGYACNADLLMGIGEVVGAGERCETKEQVYDTLVSHCVEPEQYRWYVRMKEIYPLKTSGFGMGMERFLLWVLKHDDIRDIQIVSRIDGSIMEP